MKPFALALVLGLAALGGCSRPEPPRQFSQAALDAALADPHRKAERDAADARRKPGPLIALAGVKPGDKVLDLIPGTGYWTRIFSKIVGPNGKVYAVWPQAYARSATGNVADLRKLSADQYHGNIVTEVQPTTTLTAPEPLDVVWTSQNFHDYPDEFMGKGDPAQLAGTRSNCSSRAVRSWSLTIAPSRAAAWPTPTGCIASTRPACGRSSKARGSNSPANQVFSKTRPIRSTSRCSTARSAAAPASSPTSS